jgi:hypothetical protein
MTSVWATMRGISFPVTNSHSLLGGCYEHAIYALAVSQISEAASCLSACACEFKCKQDMNLLLATWVAALPAFANVGSLVGLFMFVYAYIGVFAFGRLQFNGAINQSYNFRNFGRAFLVLVRIATGDNW